MTLSTFIIEGTRMPRVSWAELGRLPVEVPSEAEARRFEAEVLKNNLPKGQRVILYPASGLSDGAKVSQRQIE